METLNEKLSQREIAAMIKELDPEGIGKVSFENFKKMAEGHKM